MSLPTLKYSHYLTKLPVLKKEVSYRPYNVSEQKILLQALETEKTVEAVFRAFKQIAEACLITVIDVSQLSFVDLIWLMTKIRSKSSGEAADVTVACSHCKVRNEIEISLDLLEIKNADYKPEVIDIPGNDLKLQTKIPAFMEFSQIENVKEGDLDALSVITFRAYVEAIFNDKEVWKVSDSSDQEIVDFLSQMPLSISNKIAEISTKEPKPSLKVEFDCINCSEKNTILVETFFDFFL